MTAVSPPTAGDDGLLATPVRAMVAAVQVRPTGDVTVEGRVVAIGSAPRKQRLRALERALYERFHTGRPRAASTEAYPDAGFRERLELAVRIPWTTEQGWRVLRAEGAIVEAQRRGLRLTLNRSRHVPPGTVVEPGREIAIRLPPMRPGLSPGYFAVVSPRGEPLVRVGRLYMNIPSESALAFIELLTEDLCHLSARWALKTLSDPRAYGRRDGTVVYVEAATRDLVAERVVDALARVPAPARTDIPPLTLALSATIGYADEPAQRGRAVSFGQHRMSAIADGLLRQRTADPGKLRRAVRSSLLRAGVDPLAPYRNRLPEAYR